MSREKALRIVRLPFLLPPRAAAQVIFPRCVFVARRTRLSRSLLAHELKHVDQLDSLGLIRYWIAYLRLLARHGYERHPMEVEAAAYSVTVEGLGRADRILRARGQ